MPVRGPRQRYLDVSGMRFSRLVAIEFVGKDKANNARWLFRCDCGQEKAILLRHVRKGITRSCGCLHKEIVRNMLIKESGLSSLNRIIAQYKADAKRRRQTFTLSREAIERLTKDTCFYCVKQPEQIKGGIHYNGYYSYNGLDRRSTMEGYTSSNTVTACRQCNFAKGLLDVEDFLYMVERIYLHRRLGDGHSITHTI